MLGFIAEKLAAVTKGTIDIAYDAAEYCYDEVASIPGSLDKGWNGTVEQEPLDTTSSKIITQGEDKSWNTGTNT